MTNIRYIVDNLVDISTLTSTNSTSEDYVVSNIARSPRFKTFRSDNASSTTQIKGTYNSNSDVSCLVIGRHNFSDGTNYRLRLFSDTNWSTQIYDSGSINVTYEESMTNYWEWGEFYWGTIDWGSSKLNNRIYNKNNIVLWLDQLYSTVKSFIIELTVETTGSEYLYCNNYNIYCNSTDIYCNQIYIVEGSSSESGIDYFEVGRVFLGHYIEPIYNISYGHGITFDENVSQYRPNAGTLQSDYGTTNRRFEISLNTVPESDRISVHKKLQSIKLNKDIFISIFHGNSSEYKEEDYSGIVKLVSMPKFTEFLSGYYRTEYTFEES